MPKPALKAATNWDEDRIEQELKGNERVGFFVTGLSCVMHPRNPHCPTMHFNYRYFELDNGTRWFGGGTDITPAYIDDDDMRHFHGTYKKICDGHNPAWYPRMKTAADNYFVIKHRGEARGLGGIFFDVFNEVSPEEHFKFSEECLAGVTEAYVPILEKNRKRAFTEDQKRWQQIRRARYVEFNLVYDRGTVFGLKMLAGKVGRTESILMSLPETCRWEYCNEPEEGSPEAELLQACRSPRDYV